MQKLQSQTKGVHLQHRHKTYDLFVRSDGTLELYVDRCLRKDRKLGEREPQYVWTNIELEWEEHHYIEARYWQSRDELVVTVNGDEAYRGSPEVVSLPAWLD